MGAGKLSLLGWQPGQSDGECFPPILGRKASRSSFLRSSPNSRNGAPLGISPGDIPSHHPTTRRPAGLLPAALRGSLLHPDTLQPLCSPSLAVSQSFLPEVRVPAALGQLQEPVAGGQAALNPRPAQPLAPLAVGVARRRPPGGTPGGGGHGEELWPPPWQLPVVMQQQGVGRSAPFTPTG